MDTMILHVLIILISSIGIFYGLRIIKLLPKDYVIISMVVGGLSLIVTMLAFSIIRVIDGIDNVIDTGFYNWFSLFIRTQSVLILTWIIYLAFRRLSKKK